MKQNCKSDVKDFGLAARGLKRIQWAWKEMPVLQVLEARFKDQKPLKGIHISGCLHITTETANLARTLQAAGANLVLCASNPLSTQDDVAAALVEHFQIPVFAICGETTEQYYQSNDATVQ